MARLHQSLENGLKLIQVREHELADAELSVFASDIVAIAHRYDARVLVNGLPELAAHSGADGVHLTAARLMAATRRPGCDWCGASCHDAAELERARALGMDFVVLGPVAATPSHPRVKTLGWPRFAELVRDYPLPVYALGGMRADDLDCAWKSGAQGVGMLRGAWSAGPIC